jgi:hypothetical protein
MRARRPGEHQRGSLVGTVGHPLPGVVAKVVDPETGEGPLIGKDGLLLVNGPNRMQGYLGDPERTKEVLRDGWYVTGDIACIDESGFIRITDRLSRFSKVAGEMVPHMKVEEEIQALIDPQCTCVVTAVPDEARGERLVAFFTDPAFEPQALWERLCLTPMPRLWLPKRDDLRFVEAIPSLGTGRDFGLFASWRRRRRGGGVMIVILFLRGRGGSTARPQVSVRRLRAPRRSRAMRRSSASRRCRLLVALAASACLPTTPRRRPGTGRSGLRGRAGVDAVVAHSVSPVVGLQHCRTTQAARTLETQIGARWLLYIGVSRSSSASPTSKIEERRWIGEMRGPGR